MQLNTAVFRVLRLQKLLRRRAMLAGAIAIALLADAGVTRSADQSPAAFSFAAYGDSRPMMYLPIKDGQPEISKLFVEMFGLVLPEKVAEEVVKRDVKMTFDPATKELIQVIMPFASKTEVMTLTIDKGWVTEASVEDVKLLPGVHRTMFRLSGGDWVGREIVKDVPLNDGTFRPIKVVATPGTVANPIFPAPSVAGNTEGQPRIIACILGAMAKAMPGQIGANEGGTACSLLMGGTHPDTGEYWTHYQLEGCGWGGRPDRDGNSSQICAHASTIRATPIEVFESRFPLRVLEYSLRPDSGGPGRYRGGLGVKRLFEVTAPSVTLSALLDRVKLGSWGLERGKRGDPAGLFLKRRKCSELRRFTHGFFHARHVNIRTRIERLRDMLANSEAWITRLVGHLTRYRDAMHRILAAPPIARAYRFVTPALSPADSS